MNKILLTTLSLAAFTATSTAQITPSQTTDDDGCTTTIDCFKFDIIDAGPVGTDISNGGAITVKGNLTGGTYLPDVSGYNITSFVSNFNSTGTTVATINNGVLSFTGSVALVTTGSQLGNADGLGENCRTLDFSFYQCTVVDESSELFQQIRNAEADGVKVYFGAIGNERESVAFSDAFKYNERTKTYEYDSTDAFITDGKESITMYYLDSRGNAVEFKSAEEGTTTVFKDFKVTVECVDCVPEPSSTALLGLGALTLLIRRKR